MVAEPTTVVTDGLLAALAAALGVRLLRPRPPSDASECVGAGSRPTGIAAFRYGAPPRVLWGLGFLGLAGAALAGGAYHALAPADDPAARARLWLATYAATGLASFFLLAAAAVAALAGRARTAALVFLVLRFAAVLAILPSRRQLGVVLADGAVSLLLLLAYALLGIARARPEARALLAGLLISLAGGAVEALRLAPHPQFNHNDLFHLIGMAGLVLLYRAGSRL